ncbi:hypothetical protein TD95_002058 [Thielaviopsis punctulata]|uniref:Uncharacterized protein n=1 Tax=Thielaviopsis punctulata TaxID=72032 RepID=A0A0F4ZHA2_9PEZI|nr:hypothetical protein TD95_002058 [Thielaviopsis punctulata]
MLMNPKSTPDQKHNPADNPKAHPRRHALAVYLSTPSHPAILFQSATAVAIRDLFPKSAVHTLLLPRSPAHNLLHPFAAFDDPVFLAAVKRDAVRLRTLVAAELRRVAGAESVADAPRRAALSNLCSDSEAGGRTGGGGWDPDGLPRGRDWDAEVRCGVHAVPSMNHVHVHVLSRDMHSEKMKHRKHYNSFTTPFFVDLDEFPLALDDPRRARHEDYLKRDLVCWRCARNFGNRFAELKRHLDEEYEEWRRE